jgi:hypothetical protein
VETLRVSAGRFPACMKVRCARSRPAHVCVSAGPFSPSGRQAIAQRFNAGIAVPPPGSSPARDGRTPTNFRHPLSSRPGLALCSPADLPWKRWATVLRPVGLETAWPEAEWRFQIREPPRRRSGRGFRRASRFPPAQTGSPPARVNFPPRKSARPLHGSISPRANRLAPCTGQFPPAQIGSPHARVNFPHARVGFPLARVGFEHVRTRFRRAQAKLQEETVGYRPTPAELSDVLVVYLAGLGGR